MGRLIELDAASDIVRLECGKWVGLANTIIKEFYALKPIDAVPVRCKDCKHRPTGTNRDDLEFPDDKCPCECEDYWYSWKPLDNWFCGNGERKDGGNGHTD